MVIEEAPPHAHTLADDLSRCIHCGFCLQACPTYLELGLEADSPRGRIQLIAALEDGRAHPTPSVLEHLDLCLQCRACETACPSGVQFGRIMETARAEIVESGARPLSWRLRIEAMRQMLPHGRRVGALTAALRLYQRSPIRGLVRRSGLLDVLPGDVAANEQRCQRCRRAVRSARATGGADSHGSDAHRLRDAAHVSAHARRDGARAQPPRLSRAVPGTADVLRRAEPAWWRPSLRARSGAAEHRCVSRGRRRGGHRELRRLRLDDEGVRRAARR